MTSAKVVSFTPEVFKVPVKAIQVGTAMLLSCTGTAEDCQLNMKFSQPFTIVADQKVTLTMFSMVQGVALMSVGGSAGSADVACAEGTLGSVCTNLPVLVPYVGDDEGLVESYVFYGQGAQAATPTATP